MKAMRLSWLFVKLTAQYEMQYRLNFFVQLVQSGLQILTGIIAIQLVFTYTTSLGGWTRPELLVVLGVHLVLGGVMRAVIRPNMEQTIREVDEGTFDHPLVKPVDSQLLTSLRTFRVWQLTDVVLGIGIIIWGLNEFTGTLSVTGLVVGGLLLGCGATLLYSMFLILTSTAFKLIKVGRMGDLVTGSYEAGRWPVTIYPIAMRLSLSYVIPLGFAITVPAQTLVDRISWRDIGLALALTVVFAFASRFAWKAGVSSYTSASS